MFTKGALKKYGVSILLTVAIIGIVFLIGPAAALILTIDGVVVGPGTVMFNLNFDIGPGELLPGGFAVHINGDTCSFDVNANPLGGALCPRVSCVVLKKSMGIFGTFNANGTVDGYGYGYGYQYGYGYNNGELRYKCTYHSPCGQGGKLSISFSTTVDGVTFTSPSHSVNIIPQQCGGSQSGGGGGGQGFCCDAVVNFAQWHCCQKAYIARIQCCAQPQHPDCAKYCKLLNCIPPYKMDPLVGRCILSSQNEPGTGFGGQGGSNGNDGSNGSTGQATRMGGDGTGNSGGGSDGGSAGGDSSSNWPWWLLLLLALIAGFVYWRSRNR